MKSRRVVFIDTPGINEAYMSATDILVMAMEYLKKT
jgi:hypothetical protein